MATATRPAIDPAWALDTSLLSDDEIKARAEAVLELRKLGEEMHEISARLGVGRKVVENVLARRRKLGDPRALTNAQADLVRAANAASRAAVAGGRAPPAAGEVAPGMCPRRAKALYYMELCRRQADAHSGHPNVAAGYLHLADLLEHHGPRFYPTHRIKAEGDLRAMTRIARAIVHSPVGSPAAACADL